LPLQVDIAILPVLLRLESEQSVSFLPHIRIGIDRKLLSGGIDACEFPVLHFDNRGSVCEFTGFRELGGDRWGPGPIQIPVAVHAALIDLRKYSPPVAKASNIIVVSWCNKTSRIVDKPISAAI